MRQEKIEERTGALAKVVKRAEKQQRWEERWNGPVSVAVLI